MELSKKTKLRRQLKYEVKMKGPTEGFSHILSGFKTCPRSPSYQHWSSAFFYLSVNTGLGLESRGTFA